MLDSITEHLKQHSLLGVYDPGKYVITAEQYGCVADNSTLNSTAIESAITLLGIIGAGRLEFNAAGTYLLDSLGENPYNASNEYCVDVTNDNIEIYVSPASTLKLADGQQIDANGAVDMIVWGADKTNIKIHGRGEITGNTAGQTGWSGGYAQNDNGNIISSYGGGDTDIYIGKLKLTDHFSNPINLGRSSGANRLTNITLDQPRSENTGEGPQVLNGDGVYFIHPTHVLSNGMTSAGDAFEVADCTNFEIIHPMAIVKSGTPAGSVVDCFGSQNGVVVGVVADGWNDMFGLNSSGASIVDNVVISDVVGKNLTGSNILDLAEGRVTYNNVEIKDSAGTLFQINVGDTDAQPPLVLNNVTGINCARALIRGTREVKWHGGGNVDSKDYGVELSQASAGQVRTIDFKDLSFENPTSQSIRFNDGGFGGMVISGSCASVVNDNYSIGLTLVVDFSGLNVTGAKPSTLTSTSPSNQLKPGLYEVLVRGSGNLDTLNNGNENQQLAIRATGNFTVYDRTDGSGDNIYLSGAANYAMTAGDTLVLWHDNAGKWYETSRTVT